jgi:hypothetical protein
MSQNQAANPTLFRQVKIVLPPTNEHYGERVTQISNSVFGNYVQWGIHFHSCFNYTEARLRSWYRFIAWIPYSHKAPIRIARRYTSQQTSTNKTV